MDLDTQFILLGLGDPYYEKAFLKFMKKYPEKVSVKIEFNEELAHKIYAGSDIFLMPSAFEPCGLGQMISLRYGTIPIVRETGGLKDTIVDMNYDFDNGNGFSFRDMDSKAFFDALKRAVLTYRDEPGTWLELVKNIYQFSNFGPKYATPYFLNDKNLLYIPHYIMNLRES
jgi:starch synthase